MITIHIALLLQLVAVEEMHIKSQVVQETGRIITLMYPIMVIHIWVPDTIGLTYLRNIRRPMPVWNVAQFPIMAAAVISVVPVNPAGMAKRLTVLPLPD